MARTRQLGLLIGAVSLFNNACGGGSGVGEKLHSVVTRIGDTTVVVNHGKPPHRRSDSIAVVWRSPDLEDPRTLLILGGRLIVGDRTRLHFLTERGEFVRTVGREGRGPREFDYVAEVAQFGSDTVAVHDTENQRISFFTPGGDYLGSARVLPLLPYGNPVNGYLPEYWVRRGLVRLRGGVVSLWRERIPWTRPTRTALIWHDLQADTAAVLEWWDGEQFFRAGGRYAATTQLFGPRVIAALSRDGTLAVGNGVDYCIQLHVVMAGGFRKVCRDRAPAPVGAGIRHPDLRRAKNDFIRQWLATIVREQEISENLPQFDRMLFDEEDRLWIRTVGPELSDVHPYLLQDAPELGPLHRIWDVFDRMGRLLATIDIPANFDPQLIQSGRIYGFTELPTGEVAIGVLEVPL